MEEVRADNDSIPESWERVVSDLETMADEYGDAGWEVYEIHPGDVSFRVEEGRPKMKVLVADNEFPDVEGTGDIGYDSYEVHRAVDGGIAYLIVTIKNPAEESVVLVPAHYSIDEDMDVRRRAIQNGTVTLVLHRLDERSPLEFECESPSLLFNE